MEKNVEISVLCQLYGKLLTPKQFEIINDYYNNDFSLSEIAENNKITRQAVRDVLMKSEKKLYEYEEKMQFKKRIFNQENKIKDVLEKISKIQKKYNNKELTNSLNNIKKELKGL